MDQDQNDNSAETPLQRVIRLHEEIKQILKDRGIDRPMTFEEEDKTFTEIRNYNRSRGKNRPNDPSN